NLMAAAGLLVLRQERASESRDHPEEPEEAHRRRPAVEPLGRLGSREVEGRASPRRDLLEDFVLLLPVHEVRNRGAEAGPAELRGALPETHETSGVLPGKRAEKDRVDDAEDHRAGSDPQSEREDGGEREARALDERPDRVADVLELITEHGGLP